MADTSIRDKVETLDALLEGFTDEGVATEIITRKAAIADDIHFFVTDGGEEELLRTVLADTPADKLCTCWDPVCPPKQELIPVDVRMSDEPLLAALQAWEATHDGAQVYQQYIEERSERRTTVERELGLLIQQARQARQREHDDTAEA